MSGPYPAPTNMTETNQLLRELQRVHWTVKGALVITGVALIISGLNLWVDYAAWKQGDTFSVQTMSVGRVRAVKLNKRTGETWLLQNDGAWTVSPTPFIAPEPPISK